MEMETRSAVLRSAGGEDGKICGRAVVFNSPSVDMGGWREVIEPGALELDDDLYLDYDHDSARILGRASNGTLSVEVGHEGLDFVATPPATTWAADVAAMMRGGYVTGCSFAFRVLDDAVERIGDELMRVVKKAHVYALTVTGIPAYPETTSEVRDRMAAARDAGGIIDGGGTEPRGGEGEERGSERPTYIVSSVLGAVELKGDGDGEHR